MYTYIYTYNHIYIYIYTLLHCSESRGSPLSWRLQVPGAFVVRTFDLKRLQALLSQGATQRCGGDCQVVFWGCNENMMIPMESSHKKPTLYDIWLDDEYLYSFGVSMCQHVSENSWLVPLAILRLSLRWENSSKFTDFCMGILKMSDASWEKKDPNSWCRKKRTQVWPRSAVIAVMDVLFHHGHHGV